MADQDEVSLGEVYRLCLRIEQKVDKTNGRVDRHDDQIDALKQDMTKVKAVWSTVVIAATLGGDWLKHKLGL